MILTFIFEAFDEPWKGSDDPDEPEKHWGLYYENRSPKLVLRDSVDKGVFKGLTRNGNFIKKTYNGVF